MTRCKGVFRFLWKGRFCRGESPPSDADEPALELAGGLAKWAVVRVFKNEDGRYDFWHFHHGLYALMAITAYAVAADDKEILQRTDACYRWAREMGDPLIGYSPEYMPGSDLFLDCRGNSVEICEVADMVW
ncbi:MAG: hypothetical protein QGH20_11310 [Candidatus Latescibacteria bacterium]|nr:hypothetical protein [Candidatus Latescibacterota bacterium]